MKQNIHLIGFLSIISFLIISNTSCRKESSDIISVSTVEVNNILSHSATLSGKILDAGGGISAFGHCWAKHNEPEVWDDVTNLGASSNSRDYTSQATDLEPAQTYYCRAYAQNDNGVTYGKVLSFTTTSGLALVSTAALSDISVYGAKCGGNVSSSGGDEVVGRGVCWDKKDIFSLSGCLGFSDDGPGLGLFESEITELSPGEGYFVKAYAITSIDTSYGQIEGFSTDGGLVILSTALVSGITITSATSGGDITDDGGASITTKGVCWSTSQNPTVSDDKTDNGSGTASFISSLSGLSPGTTYYVRAYATNNLDTYYGLQQNFTTLVGSVTLSTAPVSVITTTSVTCGGEITDDGGYGILSKGVCWSTSQNPTVSDDKTDNGSGTASFVSSLSGLSLGTTYYVRAYATNNLDTYYGPQRIFTTRDGVIKLNTLPASDSAASSAKCGGQITDDGGGAILDRGIYYGTSDDPINKGTKMSTGSGTGAFTATLTGLSPGTRYYFVAYAMNSAGIVYYGLMLNFITIQAVSPPVVVTNTASSVLETSALLQGNVSSDGGATVTERGFYYGLSTNPASTGTKVSRGSGTGAYSASLTGLSEGTTYYYVAYATNSEGPSLGAELSFITKIANPSVVTTSASSVTETYALVGGNVTDDGGGSILERGIYYGTTSDPVNNGTKVARGSGSGSFSASLTGLSPGTLYYYVAYASNGSGTAYGFTFNFTTQVYPSTVTTSSASLVSTSSAWIGGNVVDDGGGTVTERGVYYGTSSNPLYSGTKVPIGSGTGSFSKELTGLSQGTRYYFVAYAENSRGQSNGSTLPFDTDSSNTVSDREGNVYQTVQIGNQTWMKENLRSTRYANGTTIPLVQGTTEWESMSSNDRGYCWYDNNPGYANPYGAIYSWATAVNGQNSNSNPSGVQGVCPSGWHVPSDAEWMELEMYLGMSSYQANIIPGDRGTDQGSQLKEAGISHWISPNTGTNSSGFTAIPGGGRFSEGFDFLGKRSSLWTSTEQNWENGIYRSLENHLNTVRRSYWNKTRGFSVRCVKD